MVEYSLVNDTTVAKTGTQEVRQIYGKAELLSRKATLEIELKEVNDLLALFP